jgi:type IV secretion system protein VirD4
MNILEMSSQLGLWAKAHPHLLVGGMGGMCALMLGAGLVGRAKRYKQITQGSARWATPHEIRAAGLLAPQGVVVGRLGRRLLCDASETHVLLLAPTRSGKGVGPILCTLLGGWHASALVYDPADGENATASAPYRAALGHRVAQFTPKRSPQACINVCDLIRVGTPHEFDDAWAIAESLQPQDQAVRHSDTGVHFRDLVLMLLTAAQLHMAYADPPGSLGKLLWLLMQKYRTLPAFVQAMTRHNHTGIGVHQAIHQLATGIQNITNERELSGVWTTAIRPLLPYMDYAIQRSTDRSTLALRELQHGPTPLSLYLVAPSTTDLTRLAPVYRVISDMAMRTLEQLPPRSARHRLLVIADEAPAYGYSRFLDKGSAEVAKYGIKLLIVAQDLPQLDATFGRDNSVWGNTSTKIFFAPDSDVTAKRLRENFLGKETVEQPVLSKQPGLVQRPSVSYQQVGRALMTPDELRAMHPRAAIVYRTGLRPILCGKANCLTDPDYAGRHAAPVP